jgi:hypothetical protein
MWMNIVEGDERGEYVVNPEDAAIIHERLAHLTSETQVGIQALSQCSSQGV